MPRFRTILVPVDFSSHAHAALDLAIELAKESGGELHLLHAYELPASMTMTYGVAIPQSVWDGVKEARPRAARRAPEARRGGGREEQHPRDDGAGRRRDRRSRRRAPRGSHRDGHARAHRAAPRAARLGRRAHHPHRALPRPHDQGRREGVPASGARSEPQASEVHELRLRELPVRLEVAQRRARLAEPLAQARQIEVRVGAVGVERERRLVGGARLGAAAADPRARRRDRSAPSRRRAAARARRGSAPRPRRARPASCSRQPRFTCASACSGSSSSARAIGVARRVGIARLDLAAERVPALGRGRDLERGLAARGATRAGVASTGAGAARRARSRTSTGPTRGSRCGRPRAPRRARRRPRAARPRAAGRPAAARAGRARRARMRRGEMRALGELARRRAGTTRSRNEKRSSPRGPRVGSTNAVAHEGAELRGAEPQQTGDLLGAERRGVACACHARVDLAERAAARKGGGYFDRFALPRARASAARLRLRRARASDRGARAVAAVEARLQRLHQVDDLRLRRARRSRP